MVGRARFVSLFGNKGGRLFLENVVANGFFRLFGGCSVG